MAAIVFVSVTGQKNITFIIPFLTAHHKFAPNQLVSQSRICVVGFPPQWVVKVKVG